MHGFSTLQLGSVHVNLGHEQAGQEARRRMAQALGLAPQAITAVGAVHSAEVARVDEPSTRVDGVDGLVTDRPELPLFAAFADCYPVLLFDPERRAIALGHAGWRGAAAGIAGVLVSTLQREYGSNPAALAAVVGPGICQACYEVGPEVAERFSPAWLAEAAEPGKFLLDIAAANRDQLLSAGLLEANVELMGICTSQTPTLPSHRRDHDGRRFGAMIALA